MRVRLWDILAILLLVGAVVVVAIVIQIFNDPYSSLNPFPPPKVPDVISIPTATKTPLRLPPTWTPVGYTGGETDLTLTLQPSSTPQATSTGFIMPTDLPTYTLTPSITPTPTNSRTPTQTQVNLTATFGALQTQVVQTATSAMKTTLAPTITKTPTKTSTVTRTPTSTSTPVPPPAP